LVDDLMDEFWKLKSDFIVAASCLIFYKGKIHKKGQIMTKKEKINEKKYFFFEFLIKSIEILRFCLKFNKEILKIVFPSNFIYFESFAQVSDVNIHKNVKNFQ
jgi:hypothetical protein